ncbi:MAG: virulence RhuM family protein [Proteobacteria bacterium]|nr:virulence RhuM family protein [Pseudomonadota bacterium]
MKDWDKFLVQFLELTDYPILVNTGKVTMLEAKLKAESEYDKFRVVQDMKFVSDFDKLVESHINIAKDTK